MNNNSLSLTGLIYNTIKYYNINKIFAIWLVEQDIMTVVLYILWDNNTEDWKHPFELQKYIKVKSITTTEMIGKIKKEKKPNIYIRKNQYIYTYVWKKTSATLCITKKLKNKKVAWWIFEIFVISLRQVIMKRSHLSILHLMVIQNWKFSTKIEIKKKKIFSMTVAWVVSINYVSPLNIAVQLNRVPFYNNENLEVSLSTLNVCQVSRRDHGKYDWLSIVK